MVDIHFHPLPRIDDGPASWEEAVALCRAAAEDGVETVVATPHVLRDPWLNEDPAERERLVAELNAKLDGAPVVLPGAEMWFCGDLAELAERRLEGGAFTTLAGSRYVLLEFPPGLVPPGVDSVLYELTVMGLVPVIAHPERNLVLASDPDLLAYLVSRGALAQVTAGSLLGDFGRRARAAAEAFVDGGLAHFVASDAHGMRARPVRMRAAREAVTEEWGGEVAERLFEKNPRRLVADERIGESG